MAVDEFCAAAFVFFNAHNDFFEEIAKYRAARRIWCRTMRERSERGILARGHCDFTRKRRMLADGASNPTTTWCARPCRRWRCARRDSIAARNSLDEAWALPTEMAATLALRTQQVLAHESGAASTADPFGGSFFLETLTNEVESGANDYIETIDALGGMVAAIERGYPQREIADAAYAYQLAVDRKEKIIVGVNDYVMEEKPIETLHIDESVGRRQEERLRQLRKERSGEEVRRRLAALEHAAAGSKNLMPYLYEAAKALRCHVGRNLRCASCGLRHA